jgi:hypothetical protein
MHKHCFRCVRRAGPITQALANHALIGERQTTNNYIACTASTLGLKPGKCKYLYKFALHYITLISDSEICPQTRLCNLNI